MMSASWNLPMLSKPSAARSTNASPAGPTLSSSSPMPSSARTVPFLLPAHLSLQAPHRRGWGSLYAPLDRGRIDDEALRNLLARYPLASTEGEPSVYAVDASVWARCDAETSPERGFYYHPSRHSAGQPIVAGWASQFIAHSPARVGLLPWTQNASDPPKTPTWSPQSR